jgi:hypothetical protein
MEQLNNLEALPVAGGSAFPDSGRTATPDFNGDQALTAPPAILP